MNRRHFWIGLFVLVGGCVAWDAFEGDDTPAPSLGTRNACGEFRDIQQEDPPPSDAEVIDVMLDIARFDTSASVHSAALNLADQLETGSQADVQDAVVRMDAACDVSGL